MLLPVIRLKTRRTSAHPWVFRKMVRHPRFPLEAGALVRVVDRDGVDHGAAFYHPDNTIALRLFGNAPDEPVDAAFVARRLADAHARRAGLGPGVDGFRWVNAEGDGLPALVVDRFGDAVVVEPFAAGWRHVMDWVADGLRAVLPGCRIAVRADPRTEAKEGVSFSAWARKFPPPAAGVVHEHGLAYAVDFEHGHKTGFFFDQRAHRRRVRTLARGLDVLDCCCYTGGFALNAALGGARSVTGVDLDEKAVARARENLVRNVDALPDPGTVAFEHADAYDALRARTANGPTADLVILDPSKFAEGGGEVDAAIARYGDLNRLGVRAVRSGGWLVTCSCSGAVPPARWLKSVRAAAQSAGARLVEEPLAGADTDHPTLATFPEGRYLKVLFARVRR